ncbi:ABC transporter transmembrane region 2-domain-containing protein [Rhodotorula diobovata]|uniref:ABC transporter transmembrane region 2-domain-containing protein n=1 Tax=Rhodotorula diobovata TaxID=5288 RepID=A0A5C5G0N6_9BASI|nr:ABC transporter transmembrane region 2-domain-containing protein [Rhodotorula diobovata]
MLTTPQIEMAQRDLYNPLPGGARELLVPTQGRVSKVVIRPTKASTFARHRPLFRKPPPAPSSSSSSKRAPTTAATAQRVGVNREFFRQLAAILRIIIPHATSKEVWLLGAHTTFLLLRTYLSLLVAQLDGKLVGDLVSANGKGFLQGLCYWFLLAVPSVYTNAMIRFLQSKLAISFRTRLTRYVHDLYLDKHNTFYKVVNLDARIGASGADQFVTTDVNRFCETLSALYSNVSKPSLDLILFNIQLGRSIGGRGSIGLFASYIATAWILRKVTPAFGKLAAIEAKLEGDFRAAHSRLIINSEEIAFYDGAPIEKDILTRAYLRLIKHVNSIYKIRILYGMTEDMVVKYMWSAAGYLLISIPVFFPKARELAQAAAGSSVATKGDAATNVAVEAASVGDGLSVSQRTENYISNRRLLLSLADAGGRLMLSWKDLSELAGSTSRVYTLLSTLHDLSSDNYASLPRPADLAPGKPFYDLGALNGRLVDDAPVSEGVSFDKVPIVAPAPGVAQGGEELVKQLSVRVKPGEHLLITGGNGSGKTAIARVLAGLWPVFEGVVARPDDSNIMFLPQRPYLSSGSLRDQIIYPHSYPDFAASGKTDADLMDILRKVHLSYLPAREGGYDVRKEWKDILSGGEKQRMGMARLFYHLPKYGILDECTSAVSTDVEGSMYQHAKDLGITLITISHRPSLFQHHLYLLRLTGDEGKWELTQIGEADQSLSFQKEIESLKGKLAEVESWKVRLHDIDLELHFKA